MQTFLDRLKCFCNICLLLIPVFLLMSSLSATLVYAGDGDFGWARAMGGSSAEEGTAVAVDTSGNVYTTGSFYSSTSDFDPGPRVSNLINAGGRDIFVSKLDSNGNFVWAKGFGSSGDDSAYDIVVDTSGNAYVTGRFKNTVDFDPGLGVSNLVSAGAYDVFICKLDSSGSLVWAKSMGGISTCEGNGIFVDDSGNVYTTGNFYGTVDFDPGAGFFNLSSAGRHDFFISKLDSSGNYVWAKSLGGSSYDAGNDIFVDKSGNVYTTGNFQGDVDFDPGVGTYSLFGGGDDIFVSKLDKNGDFVWARAMTGNGENDAAHGIFVDRSTNVYTTGLFQSTLDFDPGAGIFNMSSAGSADIFISKLDSNGNFIWARSMGSTSEEVGSDISVDGSGNVYIVGSFFETVDFDPGPGVVNLTSAGDTDVFISKLDSDGNFVWAKSMGGAVYDEGKGLSVNSSGKIYATGYFHGTVDFDPGVETFNLASVDEEVFIVYLEGPPSPWILFIPAMVGPRP